LTVPSEYRDALQLEKGAQVAVLRLGGALLLIPEHAHFRQLCDRVAGVFANVGITEPGPAGDFAGGSPAYL
jgi:hypothetical protein